MRDIPYSVLTRCQAQGWDLTHATDFTATWQAQHGPPCVGDGLRPPRGCVNTQANQTPSVLLEVRMEVPWTSDRSTWGLAGAVHAPACSCLPPDPGPGYPGAKLPKCFFLIYTWPLSTVPGSEHPKLLESSFSFSLPFFLKKIYLFEREGKETHSDCLLSMEPAVGLEPMTLRS